MDNHLKKLYIIGAGGCGREVYHIAKAQNELNKQWIIAGFFDDSFSALDGYDIPIGIVGAISDVKADENSLFTVALGNVEIKKAIVETLLDKGCVFADIIHPTALIYNTAVYGKGCVFYPYSIISDSVTIGDFVLLNNGTCIGHDATVGDFSTLCAHCDVTGFAKIGKSCYLSSSSVMIPHSSLGDNVFVGANSTIIGHVKQNLRVWGTPAVKMKL